MLESKHFERISGLMAPATVAKIKRLQHSTIVRYTTERLTHTLVERASFPTFICFSLNDPHWTTTIQDNFSFYRVVSCTNQTICFRFDVFYLYVSFVAGCVRVCMCACLCVCLCWTPQKDVHCFRFPWRWRSENNNRRNSVSTSEIDEAAEKWRGAELRCFYSFVKEQ